MAKKVNLLIVEDEAIAGKVINDNFRKRGFESILLSTAEEALIYFNENLIDIVLLDYKLPGMNGEELFIKLKETNPMVSVVFMTAYSSVDKAVRLLKMGAFDYITKPLEIDELNHIVDKIVDKIKLIDENRQLKGRLQDKFTFDNYIFNSDNMQNILNLTLRAADSNASILITGESGTGKEVITNIIQYHSKRKEDIPLLIDLFIKKFSKIEGKTIKIISKNAMSVLLKYNYKGNIRELENIIERGVVLARDDILMLEDLPVYLDNRNEKIMDYFKGIENSLPLPERLSIIEKNIIINSLKKYSYNQTKTADELGISESGLRYKIQNLKIIKRGL